MGNGAREIDDDMPSDGCPQAIPASVLQLLRTVLQPADNLTIRLIETWIEGKKKRSRIAYNKTRHFSPCLFASMVGPGAWRGLLEDAAEERANVFFGVCPRFAKPLWTADPDRPSKKRCGLYDLAWQIRTVRVLWSDIDHCTQDEALQRCDAAGLPRPTVVVCSGNGVHLYWLLSEPYLIDDVGDPASVFKEFIDQRSGKKKVLPYIEADGRRVYEKLDDDKTRNPEWPQLSAKAEQVQHVLGGIAAKIGGDHTTDLSRLLRLPGTMNRKDERNGREPILCELGECDPTRRYAFADFERFAEFAPAKMKAAEIWKVRVPSGVKLTATRRNRLADFVNICAVAEDRSKADFSLCCFSVRKGYSKEEIWGEVESIGKFGDRGRKYFDLTWTAAENRVRTDKYDRAQEQANPRQHSRSLHDGLAPTPWANGSAFRYEGIAGDTDAARGDAYEPSEDVAPGSAAHERMTIDADNEDLATITPQAWNALITTNSPPKLFRYGGVPSRIERDDTQALVVRALTNERAQHALARAAVWMKTRGKGENAFPAPALPPKAVVQDVLATPEPPLPPLNRIVEAPVFARDGILHAKPGYNAANRTYFQPANGFILPPVPDSPTAVQIADATALICDELLGDFPFTSDAERAHAVAFLILPFVRDMIEGPTPFHLVEKPSPGTGATLMVNALAWPALGRDISSMTEGRDEDEWRKRLFAKLRSGPAVVLLDNLRRRLDCAALASVITAYPTWEDRVLGVSETICVPVRCAWIGTGNNPALSNEMARRTVRIRLDAKIDRPWLREGCFRHRLPDWAIENRAALVHAALTLCRAWIAAGRPDGQRTIGMFESWAKTLGGILYVAGIPGFLDNLDEFYEQTDSETAGWREFLAVWWEQKHEAEIAVAELYAIALAEECLDLGPDGEGKDHSRRIRLGKMISAQRDRIYTVTLESGEQVTLRIEKAGMARRATRWQLHRVSV